MTLLTARLMPPVTWAGEACAAGARADAPDDVVSVIWNPTDSSVGPRLPMYSVYAPAVRSGALTVSGLVLALVAESRNGHWLLLNCATVQGLVPFSLGR